MVELWNNIGLTTVITEAVIITVLPWFITYTVKSMNKKQKLIEVNNQATRALTGIMLLNMLREDEVDEPTMMELYDLYKALGGNGYIDRRIDRYYTESGKR
jgi:hypothetical protein